MPGSGLALSPDPEPTVGGGRGPNQGRNLSPCLMGLHPSAWCPGSLPAGSAHSAAPVPWGPQPRAQLASWRLAPREDHRKVLRKAGRADGNHMWHIAGAFTCFGFLFFSSLFRATPEAYGSSQARSRIGAAVASLCHGHGNVGSEPHLQPIPQLKAMPDP